MSERSIERLAKKARRGLRGYPLGAVAFYGPDDRRASKVAVGVKIAEDAELAMRTWFSEAGDARQDQAIAAEIRVDFEANGVRSVGMIDRIIGCPHQEGIDYDGDYCPVCRYWINRERFTGKKLRSA